jgi:hypothetical protein
MHSEIIDDGAYLPATHGASGESFMASLGKSGCCSRRELGEKWVLTGLDKSHEQSLFNRQSEKKIADFLVPNEFALFNITLRTAAQRSMSYRKPNRSG